MREEQQSSGVQVGFVPEGSISLKAIGITRAMQCVLCWHSGDCPEALGHVAWGTPGRHVTVHSFRF